MSTVEIRLFRLFALSTCCASCTPASLATDAGEPRNTSAFDGSGDVNVVDRSPDGAAGPRCTSSVLTGGGGSGGSGCASYDVACFACNGPYDASAPMFPSPECLDGMCLTTLASGQMEPSSIAVDSMGVYWTTAAAFPTSVLTVPLDGGSPVAIASGLSYPVGLAVDSSGVYWSTLDGALARAPLDGGTPVMLASGQNNISALAIDSTNLYWGEGSCDGGAIMKMALDGGAPIVLASLSSWSPTDIAVDSTSVYWSNRIDGTVMKEPINGGTPSALATQQIWAEGIAVDGTSAYWTANCSVMKVALDGGTPVSLASIGTLEGPVAVLGSNVYFTSDLGPAQGDGVFSVPSAGGAMTTLALSMYNAFGFGVDATSVYWVTGQGSVVKLTPP